MNREVSRPVRKPGFLKNVGGSGIVQKLCHGEPDSMVSLTANGAKRRYLLQGPSESIRDSRFGIVGLL